MGYNLQEIDIIEFHRAISGQEQKYLSIIDKFDEYGTVVESDTIVVLKELKITRQYSDLFFDYYDEYGEVINKKITSSHLIDSLYPNSLNKDSKGRLILPYPIYFENSVLELVNLVNLNLKDFKAINLLVTDYLIFEHCIGKKLNLFSYYLTFKNKKHNTIPNYLKDQPKTFNAQLNIDASSFDYVSINLPHLSNLSFNDFTINGLQLQVQEKYCSKNLDISFKRGFFTAPVNIHPDLFNTNPETTGQINIEDVTVQLDSIKGRLYFKNKPLYRVKIGLSASQKLKIENCTIQSKLNDVFQLRGACNSIDVLKSKIDMPIVMNDMSIEHRLSFQNNKLHSLSLYKTALPEENYNTNLSWSQFSNHFFLAFRKIKEPYFDSIRDQKSFRYSDFNYWANSEKEISNSAYYSDLLAGYNNIYNIYKSRGDKESANPCYAKLKQIETKRLKYLYQQNKSFESLFRWQLNVFLNYFTDYGTNPAKAVIKSAWVILLFAIFYLFFPSDWDVSNRSQLLAKIKDLTSKNRERTFLWTLGFVCYSTLIHVLNALTLSLNAFTTLGFGDIPTHGAARYVTIVQGFIGWFLLTIFSVSLINQVLG